MRDKATDWKGNKYRCLICCNTLNTKIIMINKTTYRITYTHVMRGILITQKVIITFYIYWCKWILLEINSIKYISTGNYLWCWQINLSTYIISYNTIYLCYRHISEVVHMNLFRTNKNMAHFIHTDFASNKMRGKSIRR